MPSPQNLCIPCNHAPVYSVSLYEARMHVAGCRMHACLAETCHRHFSGRMIWIFLHQRYCDNKRVERIPKWESPQKAEPGQENPPALLQGLEPETFQSRVRRSITELAPSSPTAWHLGPRHSLFEDNSALNKSNQPTKPRTGLSSKAVESILVRSREKLNVYGKANQSFFYNVREEMLSLLTQLNQTSETRMTARVLKHMKGSTERCLLGQKRNLQIFTVIPLVKLQNDT